ncbi:Crp/Fnr family transcriptional regulator [Owenweeksia hongkongensis]|uniref:Crp/Fnr family transcriptional regulator n=1 Tax=Owenweeksia hongkongensis TaxID=253245 RepID=UPI003A957E69
MELTDTIDQVVHLTKDEKLSIEKYFTVKALPKGELWIKEGQYCNHIGFIKKGICRIFYNDQDGNEISCFFMPENNFISSYTSFLTLAPTKENIEAVEEVEMLVINREDLEKLSKEVPKVQIWRRVMAENLFILLERRISMLQSKTAQERYENLIKENSDILLKVPLQYTASFLGVTPQHLSRLRKNSVK